MINKNKKSRYDNLRNVTDLSKHKKQKKVLIPPFLQIKNLKTESWLNERLPEMLWAVLIIGNIERKEALDFFRYLANFIKENPECYDITITGISKLKVNKRKEMLKIMMSYSEEIRDILSALLLFKNLPSYDDWKNDLNDPIPKEDWLKISRGVVKTFNHQSEEATDCRWLKVLCALISGKLNFPVGAVDEIRGIFEYPNYGDLRYIRPLIRSTEIVPFKEAVEEKNNWASDFWQYCFNETVCVPEEQYDKKIKSRSSKFKKEIEIVRKHYIDETKKIRHELIKHFFNTMQTTTIDSRYEGSFGLAIYGLTLFIEIIFYKVSFSITSRIVLRALVETYIIFKYLLKKEKQDPNIWDSFRDYGIGQIKLIFLKQKELKSKINCIDIEEIDYIANEDKWVEFIPINLGNWNTSDLRTMSMEAKLKDLYDKFYNYTSGYTHANWGAVRESIYQKCLNPLHRFHRIPRQNLPLMLSITNDAIKIVNDILKCLSIAYPNFYFRLKHYVN